MKLIVAYENSYWDRLMEQFCRAIDSPYFPYSVESVVNNLLIMN